MPRSGFYFLSRERAPGVGSAKMRREKRGTRSGKKTGVRVRAIGKREGREHGRESKVTLRLGERQNLSLASPRSLESSAGGALGLLLLELARNGIWRVRRNSISFVIRP